MTKSKTETKTGTGTSGKQAAVRLWRFKSGETVNATLDQGGRLLIRDSEGSLEKWDNVSDYIRDFLKVSPVPKDQEERLALLAKTLGEVEAVGEMQAPKAAPISPKTTTLKPGKDQPNGKEQDGGDAEDNQGQEEEGTFDMTNVKKNKTMGGMPKPKKTAAGGKSKPVGKKHSARTAPKEKVDKGPLPTCGCGCGDQVGKHSSRFLPGHDARFHGYLAKIDDGRLTYKDLPTDEARKQVKAAIARGELKELKKHK